MSADNYVRLLEKEDGWYWGSWGMSQIETLGTSKLPITFFTNGPYKTSDEAVKAAVDELGIIEHGFAVQRTTPVYRPLSGGCVAVPFEACTINGIYLPQLNTAKEPYTGPWAIIAPNRRAIDNESGRPYKYDTLEEATQDLNTMLSLGLAYSTCDGIVSLEKPPSDDILDNCIDVVASPELDSPSEVDVNLRSKYGQLRLATFKTQHDAVEYVTKFRRILREIIDELDV